MNSGVEGRSILDRFKHWGVACLVAVMVSMAAGATAPARAQEAPAAIEEAAPPADAAPAEAAPAEEAAPAADEMTMDKGDNAFMLIATVLVLLMTVPGLALFYGGLVRTKNMASMLTQVLMIECVVCIVWFLWGYSIAFTSGPPGFGQYFGGLDRLFLAGITPDTLAATFSAGVGISELVFVCFQMTFAAITTALAVGSFAERMKFGSVMMFALLWSTIVYFPIAHMVWHGDGLAFGWGALDFAGGTVVHINAGIAGLVGCIVLGRRAGYKSEPMPPHSMTLTMVGAALLWVGWFGFNAGSNLEATGGAALAMANTFIATAAAGFSWMMVEWAFKGKPSLLGLCSGVVAGLVAVTPAAGLVGPMGALILGLVSSPVCLFFCTVVKNMLGYDDSLDVFGIHGIAGIIGAIGTGILVDSALGGVGLDDYSMAGQVTTQIKAVILTILWSGIGSLVIFLFLKVVFGLRVSEEKEREGLDISDHGERAYHY